MTPLYEALPKSLRDHATIARLGDGVPALLTHPDGASRVPFVLWMHGRTAYKELDPGRYTRWLRAGIAACAIDLPGHGERLDERLHQPEASLGVIERAVAEVDGVIGSLDPTLYDLDRAAVGGMSMGGMVTLRRLCQPHAFRAAAVEGTTGDLERLYFPPPGDHAAPWPVAHDPGAVRRVSAAANLDGFAPLPLLVLHSEADAIVPWPTQRGFLDGLRGHYARRHADPAWIEVMTWAETGAPFEHVGFGRFSNDAKAAQVGFLARTLHPDAATP